MTEVSPKMASKGAGNDVGGARKISPTTMNPDPRTLGIFETNYKMAATDGECAISTILRKKGTVNSVTAFQLSSRPSSCKLTEVQMVSLLNVSDLQL